MCYSTLDDRELFFIVYSKINIKALRTGPMDGAAFPYIIKVKYVVEGKEFIKKKWIGTKYPVPVEGDTVQLVYDEGHPEKIKIVY